MLKYGPIPASSHSKYKFVMKKAISLIGILPFFYSLCAQGPLDGYMKGRGNFDLAVSYSWMNARSFSGAQGKTYPEGYRGSLVSVFGEYGLTDRFDLVATIPYIFTAQQSGLQDGGFYAKYRPIYHTFRDKSRFGAVMGLGVSAPLSDYEPLAAGALGSRAVAVPARLIIQWETRWGPFFNITGGYSRRLDRLKSDDIAEIRRQRPDYQPGEPPGYYTVLFKTGLPAAHYYLDAWVEYQHTAKNAGTDYVPMVPDLPQAYGVSYTQIGGTAYYSETGKNGWYLSGGYFLNGRNVSKILRLTVGAVLKW